MMHYVIGDVHGEEEMLLALVAKFGSEPRQKKIVLSLLPHQQINLIKIKFICWCGNNIFGHTPTPFGAEMIRDAMSKKRVMEC